MTHYASLFWRSPSWLAAIAFLHSGCSDGYECGSQSVSGRPVEGCTDLLGCDRETCQVSFGKCDDGATPTISCEGSTCTCFDGSEQIGTCSYTVDRCPGGIDVQLDGDLTEAMEFFDECCGVPVDYAN